jgi:hypothetical protein
MARIGGTTHARPAYWLCLVVAILVGTLTACSVSIPGTPSPTPGAIQPEPSPAPPTAPPSSPPETEEQPEPLGTPTAADVGAPFDPCRTITWADFPEQVRPDNPRNQPDLMQIDAESGFSTGCRHDNSLAEIQTGAQAPGTWHFFMTHIVWGDGEWAEFLNPPAPGSKKITIGDRAARLNDDPGPNGEPKCLVKVILERGAAAVSVMDNRFDTDPCATARQLATLIAERAS